MYTNDNTKIQNDKASCLNRVFSKTVMFVMYIIQACLSPRHFIFHVLIFFECLRAFNSARDLTCDLCIASEINVKSVSRKDDILSEIVLFIIGFVQ
jgi:hypothetical protein